MTKSRPRRMLVSAAMPRHAKGTNLVLLVKLAKSGVSTGQLTNLGAEEQKLLDEHVLVSEWYPFDAFAKLLCAVHEQMLGGSDEAAMRMGEANASEMLLGVHAMFLSKGDPLRTLKGLGHIWALYFDFGEVQARATGERSAEISVLGYPDISRCHGMVLGGWMRTAIGLAGAELEDLAVDEAPWEGADHLKVSVRWSEKGSGASGP
ncbi:MAG: TIGR02265 family protein [Myxococcota bacterium]